jgi:hypothetical protein
MVAGEKKPGRISLEGVEGGRAPGLYMEIVAYRKTRAHTAMGDLLVAGAWLDAEREKNNAGGGWGAVGERPP